MNLKIKNKIKKIKIDKNTEKLINQAFLSHSKGNIKEAFKITKIVSRQELMMSEFFLTADLS